MAAHPSNANAGADPLAWMGASGSAVAALAFGGGSNAAPDITQLRHLALLPVDALELDLSDPAQRQFGDYELLELIGEGGMGVVYRARQASLDREVAIKLLAAGPWASRDFIERFKREAQNAARMQHPNIVAIYEVGDAEELHFFSMRLVRGKSLAEAVRDAGPLDAQAAAKLMRTVAEALAYAHSLGVLHLDLKPANVLLDEDGVPHVADFGLARRLDSALAVDNEEVSGTPSYMAPEQAQARAQKLSAATDIWGLGAILYELVTGEPPFRGANAQETIRLVVAGHVRRPRRLRPALPLDLEAIILKCLERDPTERYVSARALADDLGRLIEHRAVRARPLNALQRFGRWMRREPKLAAAAALIALSLIAGLAATTVQWQRAQANADRAERVRNFLVGVFQEANPDENKGKPITAQQLLEHGESELDATAAHDPALGADLATVLGTLYWYIGDYKRSQPLLSKALAAVSNPDVPDPVKVHALLAVALTEMTKNEDDAAIAHARHAIQLAHASSADKSADVANARRLIAESLTDGGNAREAEPMLREVLHADLLRDGDNSDDATQDYIQLGDTLYELSRFDDSIAASRKAIELATRKHGRVHSSVMYAFEILARAQKDSGRVDDAVKSASEAASIAAQVFGEKHRETIVARSNLFIDMRFQGRYAEALRGHLDLLPIVESMAEKRPEQLAYTYNAIAADELGVGDFAEAEVASRKALAVWEKIHSSSESWDSADTLGILAAALQLQGRYSEAETEYRRQLAIERGHEPPTSGWLNRTRASLGNLLRMMHRYPESLAELQGALKALPPDMTPIRATTMAQLSEAELAAGDQAAANTLADQALAAMRKATPPEDPQLGTPLLASANAKLASGHAQEAEALLREALTSRSAFNSADPRVLDVKVALVEALAAQGKTAEATHLRAEVEPVLSALSTPRSAELRAKLDSALP